MKRRELHRTRGGKVVFALLVAGSLATLGCAHTKPAKTAADQGTTEETLYNESFATNAGTQMVEALDTLTNLEDAQIRISMVIAQALCVGAALWVESHDSCPTADDIVTVHLMDDSLHAADAWEHPYRITCANDHDQPPVVTSAGPDGVFGTADDIVAGR